MIKLLRQGRYRLIEKKDQVKILYIDDLQFVWVSKTNTIEILMIRHRPDKLDYFLAVGRYRLYKIKDEPGLESKLHLELHAGEGVWQGYLILNGSLGVKKKCNRMIPTAEIITKAKV